MLTKTSLQHHVNQAFFFLVFASEANAWVRTAGGNSGLKAGTQASAFSSGNGDPVLFALNAVVMCATAMLCLPKLRVILSVLLHERALAMIYGYSVLSILWSANPGNSFRTSVYLIASLLQFVYIGLYFDADQQISLVGQAVTAFAVLSILGQSLLAPVQDLAPGWTGIFPSKNYLGNVMAIGLVALLLKRGNWSLTRYAQCVLCCVLLLLSQSFTSILCVLAASLVILYLTLRRSARVLLLVSGSAFLLLGTLLMPNFLGAVLGMSGKDTTLTGRDVIWAFAFKHIAIHPLLGYGYYAFWISEESSALQYLGWNPGQAHNGFINLALDEGVLGVALLLATLLFGMRRSIRQIQRGDMEGTGRWLIVLLCYLMVHNISEADFYQRPAWVVYLIAYVAASQAELRNTFYAKRQAPYPTWLLHAVHEVVTL